MKIEKVDNEIIIKCNEKELELLHVAMTEYTLSAISIEDYKTCDEVASRLAKFIDKECN
jgi:hypothetical protein